MYASLDLVFFGLLASWRECRVRSLKEMCCRDNVCGMMIHVFRCLLDVSVEDAVARQWPLIEQHAANLRPIELYPHLGQLEIWTAPGDSELEVAYNRPSTVFMKMSREGGKDVTTTMIGFQGEVYQQDEEGFRTMRTEDGLPALPEVQSAGENVAPTDEEMAELEKRLEGQDLNALYEEQQRREGKS